jgi:hypothetical protein
MTTTGTNYYPAEIEVPAAAVAARRRATAAGPERLGMRHGLSLRLRF